MESLRLLLHDRTELAERGIGWRAARDLLAHNRLTRVRPGLVVFTSDWAGLTPEQRLVLRAHALDRISRRVHVASHLTALALHGLPVVFADVDHVHTTARTERSGSLAGVIRHRGPLADGEITELCGLLCTTVERTLADVARSQRPETAIPAIDAALRAAADARGGAAAEQLRDEARWIAGRAAYGSQAARRAIDFGDARAQRAGESVSRVRLAQIGFALPSLQVPVRAPGGGTYFVDFGLDDVDVFGEFDGRGKYVDAALLAGRTPEQALLDEKQREDWIRGVTGRRVVRWGWEHVTTAASLERRLAQFGVRPSTRRQRDAARQPTASART